MKVSLFSVVFTRTEKVAEISELKRLVKIVLSNTRNGWEEGSKIALLKADDFRVEQDATVRSSSLVPFCHHIKLECTQIQGTVHSSCPCSP